MSVLDHWTDALCAELGIGPGTDHQKTVLNLASVVANKVDRRAASPTSYLLGLAVGRGEQLEETAEKVQRPARAWSA